MFVVQFLNIVYIYSATHLTCVRFNDYIDAEHSTLAYWLV